MESKPGYRTDLHLVVDSNFITPTQLPEMIRLDELSRDRVIYLSKTDTLDIEVADTPEDDKRAALLEQSSGYIEPHGPWVLDHSRLDHCVVAATEDVARIDKVYAILFPAVDRLTASNNHLRDAMHVATAIRYGARGFVTTETRMLNKDVAIRETFTDFRILSPGQAVVLAERLLAKATLLEERTRERGL